MAKRILISGGSGLVGRKLTALLIGKNYEVAWLSRNAGTDASGTVKYAWNPMAGEIDAEAIAWPDAVIHLAGANVGEGRWSAARKKEILDSRTKSTALLLQKFAERETPLKSFISAAAVGIYGNTGDEWKTENSEAGKGFLADVCVAWEKEIFNASVSMPDTRRVAVRVGVVLSGESGALVEMKKPIELMAGAPLGSGKQMMPWIHIDDICNVFLFALENDAVTGAINGVAPTPVTNKLLTEMIAKVLRKPLFLPNVPAFVLRILLGEMADIVLYGNRPSASKLLDLGFEFKYLNLETTLRSLLSR